MMAKTKNDEQVVNEWNQNYSQSAGINIIRAIRVEQGEYSVASLDIPIGTYNVQQCTVIHAINKNDGLHGLAHIDGHTEIQSLVSFFQELKPDKKNIEIQILGSNSNNISGLNNSEENLAKVKNYLNREDIKSALTTDNIQETIDNRSKLKDFVINGQGKVTQGLAEDGAKNRLLHTIQEVKRQDRYLGTYPLCKAASAQDNDKTIFLDERVIVKLAEYKKKPNKDIESRQKEDPTDYKLYDTSIPVILEHWNRAIDNLVTQGNIDNKYNEEELKKLITTTPIYIGENSEEKNTEVINCIKNSSDIDTLRVSLLFLSKNGSTIGSALEIAKQYDTNLNTDQVLQALTNNYNEKHNTSLHSEQISQKSYGAEISVEEFISELDKNSAHLKALTILNSQGGYSLSTTPYTIADAKNAASTIELPDKPLTVILEQQITEYNANISQTLASPELRSIISRVAQQDKQTGTNSYSFDSEQHQKRNDLLLNKRGLTNEGVNDLIDKFKMNNKEEFKEEVSRKIELKTQENKLIQSLTDKDKYNCIQDEFLKNANLPNFSPISISLKLNDKVDTKNLIQKQNNNLTRTEKENFRNLLLQEELNSDGKYNLNDRLATVNDNQELLNKFDREAAITANIEIKTIDAKKSIETNKTGSVEIRGEQNHIADHTANTKALISEIQTSKIDNNTVIAIERKQYGENLGMKDVIKIASILKHNEKSPDKPLKLPTELENTPILQDAILYKTAKEKGIKVISLEGRNLEHTKGSALYDENREQYMRDVINEVRSKGYNVIANVGSSHVTNLEKILEKSQKQEEGFSHISRKVKQEALDIAKLIPADMVSVSSLGQAYNVKSSNLAISALKKNKQVGI